MARVPGVTVCPSCTDELAPEPVTDDRPVQSLRQHCEDCAYETVVAVLWYPRTRYEVIGELDGNTTPPCDDCEADATYAVIDSGTALIRAYACPDCVRAHHENAYDTAVSASQ